MSIKWENKTVPLSEIKPQSYNPRKISKEQMQSLKDSLSKFDLADPIIINTNGNIIGGHQRIKALSDAGAYEVDVRYPSRELTVDEEKELNLRLNQNKGEFDLDLLIENFDQDLLKEVGFEMDFLKEAQTAEEDDFEQPDTETLKTDIKLGDIIEIGEHRLMCGDSTSEEQVMSLMNGEKADMVFTDPPFPNNSEIMHDMIKNIDGAFNNSRLFCDKLMIWFWDNLEFPPFLEQVTSKHIWHKTNGWQAGHFETMYCYHNDEKRHEQKVYSVNNVGGDNNREEQGNHPTPKPISLIFEIINDLSKNSKLILDLFLGSGTTMLASHQLKRKCYGMELDPKYCQVIVNRMRALDDTLTVKINNKVV